MWSIPCRMYCTALAAMNSAMTLAITVEPVFPRNRLIGSINLRIIHTAAKVIKIDNTVTIIPDD